MSVLTTFVVIMGPAPTTQEVTFVIAIQGTRMYQMQPLFARVCILFSTIVD